MSEELRAWPPVRVGGWFIRTGRAAPSQIPNVPSNIHLKYNKLRRLLALSLRNQNTIPKSHKRIVYIRRAPASSAPLASSGARARRFTFRARRAACFALKISFVGAVSFFFSRVPRFLRE